MTVAVQPDPIPAEILAAIIKIVLRALDPVDARADPRTEAAATVAAELAWIAARTTSPKGRLP